ncbi:uncharacterized protein LOC118202487 isoform X2 [Stegodyphus dumicola]|uniref:uncharacterized protein LOC118202487 isoform X2 n=1 Tax=Stegodyphus dumicola TaxID=202533 RepID=UPI0015AA37A2|nr:uncharacterized protein LOC118202487 isoform X2 [Stegodyphus dumicola]
MCNGIANTTLKLAAFIFLLFLAISTSHRYEKAPHFRMGCDISGIHLLIKFETTFTGAIYAKDYFSAKMCSVQIPEKYPATVVTLDLPISACGSQIFGESGNYNVFNIIEVDDDNSSYILERTLLCGLENLGDNFVSFPQHWSKFRRERLNTWFEIRFGIEVMDMPEQNSGHQLILILVAYDESESEGIRIENCFISDEKIVTENSTVYRMSDPEGCYHSDDILHFTVLHKPRMGQFVVYSEIKPFAVPVMNDLYLTCTVFLCKHACLNFCKGIPKENKNIPTYINESKKPYNVSDVHATHAYLQQRYRVPADKTTISKLPTDKEERENYIGFNETNVSTDLTDMAVTPILPESSFSSLAPTNLKTRGMPPSHSSESIYEFFSYNITVSLSPSQPKWILPIYRKIKKTPGVPVFDSSATNSSMNSCHCILGPAVTALIVLFTTSLIFILLLSGYIYLQWKRYRLRDNIPLYNFQ